MKKLNRFVAVVREGYGRARAFVDRQPWLKRVAVVIAVVPVGPLATRIVALA